MPTILRNASVVAVEHRLNQRGLQTSNVVPMVAVFDVRNLRSNGVTDFLHTLDTPGIFGPSCIRRSNGLKFNVVARFPLIVTGAKAKSVPFEQKDDADLNDGQANRE